MPLMSTANWRDEMIEGLNDRGLNDIGVKRSRTDSLTSGTSDMRPEIEYGIKLFGLLKYDTPFF